ncbi:unnamed protein product [Chrysodeixis includens]|uniref:Uncharacterized protein n=1 Tax=Chrysodeixis includens TaxID=689277 RepID=A0A9P0FVP4_CHRIL|nr:unnamed protein product [Chrysodeixis includens]
MQKHLAKPKSHGRRAADRRGVRARRAARSRYLNTRTSLICTLVTEGWDAKRSAAGAVWSRGRRHASRSERSLVRMFPGEAHRALPLTLHWCQDSERSSRGARARGANGGASRGRGGARRELSAVITRAPAPLLAL